MAPPASSPGKPAKASTFASSLQKYGFTSSSSGTSTGTTPTASSSPVPRRVTRSTRSTAPTTVTTSPSPIKRESSTTTIVPPTSPSPIKRQSSIAAFTTAKSPSSSLPAKRPAPSSSAPPFSNSSFQNSKRARSHGYAPPSTYAHLDNKLRDSLQHNLICLFVGVNPGIQTATQGHAYAHPSNLFWKLAHTSRCTPRLCAPAEDQDLPRLWALGHTNIVVRPTRDASQLSAGEMEDGVRVLEDKCRACRPESVCLVGKGVWEAVFRVWMGRAMTKRDWEGYGWMDRWGRMGAVSERAGEGGAGAWKGARVFVATTTSGLAAGMSLAQKEEVWQELGRWVQQRRTERGIPDEGGVPDPPVESEVATQAFEEGSAPDPPPESGAMTQAVEASG